MALLTDVSLAKEIQNLQQESQALQQIRDSMGSDEFSRKIFQKVFQLDVDRLRSMEDMWKSRTPPQSLDFDELSTTAKSVDASIAQRDQVVWSKAESFIVFCDRFDFHSLILNSAYFGKPSPIKRPTQTKPETSRV